jgi:methylglutaconyl-CoA hydratase
MSLEQNIVDSNTVETTTRDGVRWLWLNRPQLNNAFDDRVIAALQSALTAAVADALHAHVQTIAVALNQNGPQALGECKRLIRDVSSRPLDNELVALTANRIAHIRIGTEGQEGLRAFLQKREPAWRNKD